MIILVPFSTVSPELLEWVRIQLSSAIGSEVELGDLAPLPAKGYNPSRKQYAGDAILNILNSLPYPASSRVIGLIDVDCYAGGLNFIFGQAMVNGKAAFVALPRLKQTFYDLPENQELYRERVLKEVVHELGHTWGLAHCTDPVCVMHFSNSLRDTDIKGVQFCSRCRHKL
ncbi:MAG: archaemetzincin family Zn-dependent metalloprotease [Omnitrophica WOR_2 bacterium]